MATIATAGRWDNEAEADSYTSLPPGWEFFLHNTVSWPTPSFGVEYGLLCAYQLWAMGALGP